MISASIGSIYSSKHFDSKLMWYKIEKICLACVHSNVCLIVSLSQEMGGLNLRCKCISFLYSFVGTTANIYLAEKNLGIAKWPIEVKKQYVFARQLLQKNVHIA